MKVSELLELLQQEDPEALVVFSKDSEGNEFKFVDEIEACIYVPQSEESYPLFKGDVDKEESNFREFLESYYDEFVDFDYDDMCKTHGKQLTDSEVKDIIFNIQKETYISLIKDHKAVCIWSIN